MFLCKVKKTYKLIRDAEDIFIDIILSITKSGVNVSFIAKNCAVEHPFFLLYLFALLELLLLKKYG